MSLLPNDTYANPGRALWAVAGSGGGGGGGSTLQSPASITPAVNGSASLTVAVASGVAQEAVLTVSNTTGNDSVVNLVNTAGGNSLIQMGLAASPVGLVVEGANPTLLQVGASVSGSVNTPNLVVDTANDAVTVYNLLGVANPGFGNALAAAPLTANTSKVTQTLAAGGSLSLGSSVANPAGLLVSDIAAGGFTNHVEVAGVGANPALLLSGAQTSGNTCVVAPLIAAAGVLSLGSSSTTNAGAIVVSDTATLINKLGGAPQVLAASGNLSPGNVTPTTAVFPCPTGEGLYCIMVGSTPVSTQNSRDAQLATMAYINSAGRCQIGGNGTTVVGSGGSLDIYPLDGTSNFFLTYNGTQQLNNISVVAFKISGAIPGGF